MEINFFPQLVDLLGGYTSLQHFVNFIVVMAVPYILVALGAFLNRQRSE